MISKALQKKIDDSIALLQKAEKIALHYHEEGFYLAFSGGKDSICIHKLAEMANVKFKAFYHNTTIDPPDLLKFIKKEYPNTEWVRPERTFFQICKDNKMLPSRLARFCCRILKEGGGVGWVTITGVRKAESAKRAKREEFELLNKFSGTIDQFNRAYHQGGEVQQECMGGKDKIVVNPILNWTDNDVWNFIRENNIPYPSLYDEGWTRIGCLLCPMASSRYKYIQLRKYPRLRNGYVHCIQGIKEEREKNGDTNKGIWLEDNDTIFDWYVSSKNYAEFLADKKMPTLFDDIDEEENK